ncbi:unnamed protein product [Sphagnum jensenii]
MAQAMACSCSVASKFAWKLSSEFALLASSRSCSSCSSPIALFSFCFSSSFRKVRAIQRQRLRSHVLALAGCGGNAGCDDEEEEGSSSEEGARTGDSMLAEFMQYVNTTKQLWPLEGRNPTALMPPTTVVRVQMDALMRNDWPEENSGIKTAFAFAMPARVDEILAGQVRGTINAARAWDAAERYLSLEEFGNVLRQPMYSPLINCSQWEIASPLIFHGPQDKRGLQAVRVASHSEQGDVQSRVFTFCLEKVQSGAFKDCWMVVGLRVGDYANV